jgi:hypothetical protein
VGRQTDGRMDGWIEGLSGWMGRVEGWVGRWMGG